MRRRHTDGRYAHQPYWGGIKLLVTTMVMGATIQWLYTEPAPEMISPAYAHELISPLASVQPTPSPTATPKPTPVTEQDRIKAYIHEVFGKDGDKAEQMATCESGLDPNRVGDTNLMGIDPKYNEEVGDSIGLFQIRTGEAREGKKHWNRARANNMTADEFRVYLKDFKHNVDYAKSIFDRQGWTAWHICTIRTGGL